MAGLTDISLGNFSTISYADDVDTPTTYTDIVNVQTLTHPTDERNIVEVGQYGQIYPRKLVGSSTTGNAEVVVNFDPSNATHQYMLAGYVSGDQIRFRITVFEGNGSANGSYFEFIGRVSSKSSSGEFDAVTTVTFSIAVDGAIDEWDNLA